MGDVRHEPSMEEILSSIKRIIAEDSEAVLSGVRDRGNTASSSAGAVAPSAAEEVLDLTSATETDAAAAPAVSTAREALISGDAAEASRQSLAALGAVAAKPAGIRSDPTLEAVVREMLRPMLKDWLDAHLPELVERLVAREIERLRD